MTERRLDFELENGMAGLGEFVRHPRSIRVSGVVRAGSIWSFVPQSIADELRLVIRRETQAFSCTLGFPVLWSWTGVDSCLLRTTEEVLVGGDEVVVGSTVLAKLGIDWVGDEPLARPVRLSFRSNVRLKTA